MTAVYRIRPPHPVTRSKPQLFEEAAPPTEPDLIPDNSRRRAKAAIQAEVAHQARLQGWLADAAPFVEPDFVPRRLKNRGRQDVPAGIVVSERLTGWLADIQQAAEVASLVGRRHRRGKRPLWTIQTLSDKTDWTLDEVPDIRAILSAEASAGGRYFEELENLSKTRDEVWIDARTIKKMTALYLKEREERDREEELLLM